MEAQTITELCSLYTELIEFVDLILQYDKIKVLFNP